MSFTIQQKMLSAFHINIIYLEFTAKNHGWTYF